MYKNSTRWPSLLLLGWMLVMPLSFSSVLSWKIVENMEYIENWKIWQWVFSYTIIILTMTFALTPTTVIALVSGYFLGFNAILPVVISYSLASIAGYYISKPLGPNFQTVIRSSYPKIDSFVHQMMDKSPISFVIFSRISPVLPFAVMNVVLPLVGIRFKPFFWGGLIGMLPRTLLAILTGKLAKNLFLLLEHPSNSVYMQIGFISLLLLSILGFVFLFKKKNTK